MSNVRMVGGDNHSLYFVTPSLSDPKKVYDMILCRHTGTVECNCPDAQCRKKVGNITTPKDPACKHVNAFMSELAATSPTVEETAPNA